MNPPLPLYTPAWAVSGYQRQLITCLAISPAGTRLVVASEDNTLLLVNFDDGSVLGVLCFEHQFTALAMLWYAESNLIIGCSNGSLYDICFNPINNKYTVTMCPFLGQMTQQVRALAFDSTENILAVGYGNAVALFSRTFTNGESAWNQIETIKGPCNNRSGLVNALIFYPVPQGGRHLLIAYAEWGWSVWSNSNEIKRTEASSNHNVCRVGRMTLSSDNKSVAVSTLDHTIVIYSMGEDGPILSSMKEFPYQDSARFSPIVPVAFTSNGLALGGTACGDIPVVQTDRGEMSLMRHEEGNHVIRVIETYGQHVIVGSSSYTTSVVKCYSPSVVVPCGGQNVTSDPFRVTVTEAMSGWESSDSNWPTFQETESGSSRNPRFRRSTIIWSLLFALVLLVILSYDPPSGLTFNDAKKESYRTDMLKPRLKRHEYWVLFGVQHFLKYLIFQCTVWLIWLLCTGYGFLRSVIQVVPQAMNFIALGTAKWMCERVETYRDLGVCPKLEY